MAGDRPGGALQIVDQDSAAQQPPHALHHLYRLGMGEVVAENIEASPHQGLLGKAAPGIRPRPL